MKNCIKSSVFLCLTLFTFSAAAFGSRQPKEQADAVPKSSKNKSPSKPTDKFLYAGTGVLSDKNAYTLMRMHPAEVDGLPQVRSRFKIHSEGIGFALGKESVFANNVEMMETSHYSSSGKTGTQLIQALQDYSKAQCIGRLLLAAHGFGSSLSGGGRDAISKGSVWRDSGLGFYLNGAGPSVEGTLKKKIESGQIRFCTDVCEIYFHACSISKEFASSLSKVTGCNVVASDYKVSPISPTYGTASIKRPTTSKRNYRNIGEFEQVWFTSGAGQFWEYLPNGARKKIGQSFIFDPDYILK